MDSDLDPVVDSVFARTPATDVRVSRTTYRHDGQVHRTGWTVTARFPRMGRRGQLLGRGSDEELHGDGDTPEEAADKLVEFYEYRRAGKV